MAALAHVQYCRELSAVVHRWWTSVHLLLFFVFYFKSYVALPKGGLVPEHVLILPIGHHSASTDTPQVQ